jgi:4-hydroxybenzoyl-CoA reductase beta subunit
LSSIFGGATGKGKSRRKMRLPPFLYLAPRTKKEAVEMLSRHRGTVGIVAGGTDMVNRLRQRLVSPAYVMSLKGVEGFRGIEEQRGRLVIAAGTTLREIGESQAISASFFALVEAAGLVAAPSIRSMATIGGNLLQNTRCLFYNQSELVRSAAPTCLKDGGQACSAIKGARRCSSVYQGDMAPVLIAFDAEAVLRKAGGTRRVPVAALFSGDGTHPLTIEEDELLTEIRLPFPRGAFASSYRKLRMRSGLDYPLASSACFLSLSKKGVIDRARLVIGAAGPAPLAVEGGAALLTGVRPEEADPHAAADRAFREAGAIDNLLLPGAYRKKMVKVVARRAVEAALAGLRGA